MTGASGWEPEHAVSEPEAAALIAGQFPELRGAPVEPLAVGWDNTVFRVGEWIFRFPRRAFALPGVVREIEFLPRLAPRLTLPIPVPEFIGRPAAGYPWPFWGARPIPGTDLAEAETPEGGWVRAAAQLGGFLRILHGPATIELCPGLPRDPMHRTDPGLRARLARERLARLAEQGLWTPGQATEDLLAEGERLGPPEGEVVVSHGDLHLLHLLVRPDGGAAGVIDWGDLCVADPAADLPLAYAAFSGPARQAFFDAYGPVPPDRELRARVLAVFLCAALADWAASTGRDRLLRTSLGGLDRAIS